MKKLSVFAALALCLTLLAAPAFAYEYLLKAQTDARYLAPSMVLDGSDGYEEPEGYFYVGADPIKPDLSAAGDTLEIAAIRQQIYKDLGEDVEIAVFNFDALVSSEKVETPQHNPDFWDYNVVDFPEYFLRKSDDETYDAYVSYDMYGGTANDPVWVYSAYVDYENGGNLVIHTVDYKKTAQYLITKHEHLTPVVFVWKPGSANLPNTGDQGGLLALASAVMLFGAAAIALVMRRRTA